MVHGAVFGVYRSAHIHKQLPTFALNVKQFDMEISIETQSTKEFHISHLMRSRGGDIVQIHEMKKKEICSERRSERKTTTTTAT